MLPRAVIDHNVWVSGLLNRSGPPARILAALEARRFTLVTSEALLHELAELMTRPRLVRLIGLEAPQTLQTLLRDRAQLAPTPGQVRVCRDPDDDVVVETAILGAADVLVSRDEDLTRAPEVAEYLVPHGIRVLTVPQFLELLEDGEPATEE